jgi:phosphopantothenoylcysteine decarboxylase/phosphopantothenate--cysteine ligase
MATSSKTKRPRRILIGISGGVAAYKMADVVSRLIQGGDEVTVAMTRDAQRFVGKVTFASLSGRPVMTNPWKHPQSPESPHITLARETDLMLIAPATMNMLAKLTAGLADDAVSLLAASIDRKSCPVLVAPSMNETMLQQPATQRNLKALEADGFVVLTPDTGWQACRTTGAGRLPEPAALVDAVTQHLS